MDDDLHPVVKAFVNLMAMATAVFGLWCTYIAFAGGTTPLLGWDQKGGAGQGLLWLFIITPIITTVGYWIALIVTLPLAAIFRSK